MIPGITPLSPSNLPNIQAEASFYQRRRRVQPAPPTPEEGQKNDSKNDGKKIKLEQENNHLDTSEGIAPPPFKIHRLSRPGSLSGDIPDIVNPHHLNHQKLLLNNVEIHKVLDVYNARRSLNQKISRKSKSGLPYSVNLVQNPQISDEAYLIIHYRNCEADSEFYSAKEAAAEVRKQKSGVFADGGTSYIRIAQAITVKKKNDVWVLPEGYTHHFGVRKVSNIDHPHTMQEEGEKTRLLGMHAEDFPIVNYQQGEKQVVFMPYLPGKELLRVINDDTIKDNKTKLSIVIDILNHLLFIYNNGYIHRDLKLENILYDAKSYRAKIIDFGLAIKLEEIDNTRLIGTPSYMPDALLTANEYRYTLASDLWALGHLIKLFIGALVIEEDGSIKTEIHSYNTPKGLTRFIRHTCIQSLEEYRGIIGKRDPLAEILFNIANYCLDYETLSKVPAESYVQHLKGIIREITELAQSYNVMQQPVNIMSATDTTLSALQSSCPTPAPHMKAQTLP